MEEPGRLQSTGSRRVGHNWATSLSLFTFMHWRRKWQPTPVFVPGEFQFVPPGLGAPGGLLSMGSHRVGHDWSDLAAAAAEVHRSSWFCSSRQTWLHQKFTVHLVNFLFYLVCYRKCHDSTVRFVSKGLTTFSEVVSITSLQHKEHLYMKFLLKNRCKN